MEYVVVTIKEHDEFIELMTYNRDDAIEAAREAWAWMTDYDQKHSRVEVRRFADEDDDDYDTIEWR